MNLLLARADLSDELRLDILTNPHLTEDNLFTILAFSVSAEVLRSIYKHPQASAQVKQFLYINDKFTATTLIELLQEDLVDEEEIHYLLDNSPQVINSLVLTQIAKHFAFNSGVVHKILDNPFLDEQVLSTLVTEHYTPELIQDILTQTNAEISTNLLSMMGEKAFSELKNSTSASDIAAWEGSLAQLFEHSIIINAGATVLALLKKNSLSANLSRIAISLFGADIIKELRIEKLSEEQSTKIYTEDELKIVLATTTFTKEALSTLVVQCNSEDAIELFLKQEHLQEEQYLSILGKEKLNAKHLQQILGHQAITQAVFNRMCASSSVTSTIRDVLCTHDLFNADALSALLTHKGLIQSDELLSLFDSFSALMDTRILQQIATDFVTNEDLFTKVISHSQATAEVITMALNNPWFMPSADLLQKIINQNATELSPILVKELANYALDEHVRNHHATEWGALFLSILALSQKLDIEADIIQLIKQQVGLGAFLALQILAVLKDQDPDLLKELPIEKMIAVANTKELELLLNPSILKHLGDNARIALLNKCTTDRSINLFLDQQDHGRSVLLHAVNKTSLSESHLERLLDQSEHDEYTLELLYIHPATTEYLREKIQLHPAFSATMLLNLLDEMSAQQIIALMQKSSNAITSEVLEKAAQKFDNQPQVLDAIASYPQKKNTELLYFLAESAMTCYVYNPDERYFAERCLINVFKQLQEQGNHEFIKQLIQNYKYYISTEFAIRLFDELGSTLLSVLPVNKMIAAADNTLINLDKFIALRTLYPSQLEQLARKKLKAAQIDALMNRKEMTSATADLLFAQNEYRGSIRNWTWLTEKQLISTLNHTSNYHSFETALKHPNLSEQAREQWLNKITQQQEQQHQLALRSKDPQQIAVTTLGKLKIKAYSHAVKSVKDSTYKDVAQTAFQLYHNLDQEIKQMGITYKPNYTALINQINKAKPILETHRGYKQILVDILNACLTVFTVGVKACFSSDWRFFKTNTDSINVVNEVNDCIVILQRETGPQIS